MRIDPPPTAASHKRAKIPRHESAAEELVGRRPPRDPLRGGGGSYDLRQILGLRAGVKVKERPPGGVSSWARHSGRTYFSLFLYYYYYYCH